MVIYQLKYITVIMDYKKCILNAIDFIENNLFEEIRYNNVANQIGFSEYHFHRIFQGMIGESVTTYIKKRRLSEMAKLLQNSNKSIADLSIMSGYESHEAFTRAFKKMYGVTPIQYKKRKSKYLTHQKTRLTEIAIEHLQAGITLRPHLKTKKQELVIGMAGNYPVNSKESFTDIRKLWKLFKNRKHEINNVKQGYALGVCLPNQSNTSNEPIDKFFYMAGLPVSKVTTPPKGMRSCLIPQARYAVFTHKGHLDNLPETINYIWGTWIPKNIPQYHLLDAPDFELYDSRFDPSTSSGEFDIYIPIEHD